MKRSSFVSLLFAAAMLAAAPASHAVLLHFKAFLDGPSESPPVLSDGTGSVVVNYDSVAHTLSIDASWSGLEEGTTVAHIHCCTAAPFSGTVGVAVTPGTLPGFPVGVTEGDYAAVIDLTLTASYTGAFLAFGGGTVAGAEAALIDGFEAHTAYFNIHSTFAPTGEIRGFLVVPEPGILGLLGLGLGAAFFATRRRRS